MKVAEMIPAIDILEEWYEENKSDEPETASRIEVVVTELWSAVEFAKNVNMSFVLEPK